MDSLDDYLKDDRVVAMREMNPLIRNGIYTTLQAVKAMKRSRKARDWINMHVLQIPSYWETPELLPGYAKSLKNRGKDIDAAA
jgi:hypothetical protein